MKNLSLRKKLTGYSAIAATVLSIQNSEAQIVYHDLNPDVNVLDEDTFYLDLDNDGVNDFQFVGDSNWELHVRLLGLKLVRLIPIA
jgi:hypothetical protein